VLGDADNDPNHHQLPREDGAMRQGPHRFAHDLATVVVARPRRSAFARVETHAPGGAFEPASHLPARRPSIEADMSEADFFPNVYAVVARRGRDHADEARALRRASIRPR
jgi:hypothetical protein